MLELFLLGGKIQVVKGDLGKGRLKVNVSREASKFCVNEMASHGKGEVSGGFGGLRSYEG